MRIVTALHLESWADTLTAKQELPGVVASLIRVVLALAIELYGQERPL